MDSILACRSILQSLEVIAGLPGFPICFLLPQPTGRTCFPFRSETYSSLSFVSCFVPYEVSLEPGPSFPQFPLNSTSRKTRIFESFFPMETKHPHLGVAQN